MFLITWGSTDETNFQDFRNIVVASMLSVDLSISACDVDCLITKYKIASNAQHTFHRGMMDMMGNTNPQTDWAGNKFWPSGCP